MDLSVSADHRIKLKEKKLLNRIVEYDKIWFGLILWHIIVAYLIPNPFLYI